MMGNIGGLVATWTYLPGDAPRYNTATGTNIASLSCILLTLLLLGQWMSRDNRKRDAKQSSNGEAIIGLNDDEIQKLDNNHPAFRWNP